MQNPNQEEQIQFNKTDLYKEETYTDRKVGSIKKMTPVTVDGDDDSTRPVLFLGQSQMMTPMGAIPLNFEIPGITLSEALENFGEAAEQCVQETVEELQRMQREQASSIVLPGQSQPGGRSIQMP